MEKKKWFICEFYVISIIAFITNNWTLCDGSKISDLRLCADDDCKTVLSLAKTLARHQNNDPIFLTFSRGEIVQVLSKSAGNRPDLWGGQIGDRKGYFPRSFVREYKVEIPNPGKVVPTEEKKPEQILTGSQDTDDTELDDDTDVTEDEEFQSGKEIGTKPAESDQSDNMKYAEKQTRDESKVTNNEEQKDEEELHNKPDKQIDVKEDNDETEVGDDTEIPEDDEDVTVEDEEGNQEAPSHKENVLEIIPEIGNKQVQNVKQMEIPGKEEEKTEMNNKQEDHNLRIKEDQNTIKIIESEDGLQISDEVTQGDVENTGETGKQEVQKETRAEEESHNMDQKKPDTFEKVIEDNGKEKDRKEPEIVDSSISNKEKETVQKEMDMETSIDKEKQVDEHKNGDGSNRDQQKLINEIKNSDKGGTSRDQEKQRIEQAGILEVVEENMTSSDSSELNDNDHQIQHPGVGDNTQDEKKVDGSPDDIRPTPASEGSATMAESLSSEVKPSPDTPHESLPVHATPSLESLDGFTIIDGTPFPLDMFDDSEKTVGSVRSSTPDIKATSTQEVVHDPSTENSPTNKLQNTDDVGKVPTQSIDFNQQKVIQVQEGQQSDMTTKSSGDSNPNISVHHKPDEPEVKADMDKQETVGHQNTNLKGNGQSNEPVVQQQDKKESLLDKSVKDKKLDDSQSKTDSLISDQNSQKPQVPSHKEDSLQQLTSTPSGHPDVVDVTEEFLKDQIKDSGTKMKDQESNIPLHGSSVNDKPGQPDSNVNDIPTHQKILPFGDKLDYKLEHQAISTGGDAQQTGSPIDDNKLGQATSKERELTHSLQSSSVEFSSTEDAKSRLEDIKGSLSVSEQLMSSMEMPAQPDINQATMILKDNSDVKFGIANDTRPPTKDAEPQVHDIYTTGDFVSRKPLSHDSNVASIPGDNLKSNVKTEEKMSVTPPPVQSEIPSPPSGLDVTPDSSSQKPDEAPQDTVLTRRITDDNLEEMENKEYRDQYGLDSYLKVVVEKLPPSIQTVLEQEPLGLTPQMTVLVTIVTIVMATLISCITFAFGGKQKARKSDPLVVVRGLEEKLFIATKERENLEDELESSLKKIRKLEDEVKVQTSSSGTIATEVGTYKALVKDHEKTVSSQQNEIDKLNNELTQKKKELQSKTSKLEESQKQLKKKEQSVESVSEKLKSANKELDDTKTELKSAKNQNIDLTKQIEQLEVSKQQLLQEAEGWNEKVQEITERYEALQKGQTQTQEDLALKDNEIEVLRDCFLQLKAFEDTDSEDDGKSIEDKLKSMMDVSGVNAQLKMVDEDRNLLQNRVDIEVQSRMDMEEQIAELESKLEALKTDKMKAERQSNDATTKLNVLSNYFKEKEAQLQKELGEQEALKKQNINKLESADEVTKMVQEELENYRLQSEDLKKEILSAERDFRSQIAANEKKAHDNWLSARAAERELKESRHECSVLRQKLTDLERRLMHGPSGLIRPLPTRGMPPPGMMNGPPDRPGSRSGPFPPPPGMRDDDMRGSPVRLPPPDRRSRMPPSDPRSPPPLDRHGGPRLPPPDPRSPPPLSRGPPPPMDGRGLPIDRRSPPPFDRHRGLPGYRMPPPPDMLPPHLRGPPPPHTSPPPGNPRLRAQDPEVDPIPRQSSQV